MIRPSAFLRAVTQNRQPPALFRPATAASLSSSSAAASAASPESGAPTVPPSRTTAVGGGPVHFSRALRSCRPGAFTAAIPRPFDLGLVGGQRRSLSTAMFDDDLRARLDTFQDLFVEARMSIEDCAEEAGTTYFDEEAEIATEAVNEAVQCFDKLLLELDEETKGRVVRQNGLKVEQLKGELKLVLNGGH